MFFMEKTVIRTNIGIERDAARGIARIHSLALVPCDWSRLFLGLALLVLSGIFTPAEAQFGNGYSYREEVICLSG